MAAPSKDWKTIYFGRMSVEIPQPFTLVWNKAVVSDVALQWFPVPQGSTFVAQFAKREALIRKLPAGGRVGGPLARKYTLTSDKQGWQYVSDPDSQAYTVELWQNYGDHILIAKTLGYADEIASAESDVRSVVDSFERSDGPVKAGLAVDGGVLHRDFDTNEDISLTVYLERYSSTAPGNPTMMNLATTVYPQNGRSDLLNRATQGQRDLLAESRGAKDGVVHFERKGPRTVGGMRGVEVFYSGTNTLAGKEQKDANAEYQFGGLANNAMSPSVEIHFSIGPYDTEPDAPLKVWDGILNSWEAHR